MPAPKTELENYLIYGIDEKNRKVYFGTSLATASFEDEVTNFTQVSVEYAIRSIERMATDYPKVPIEIHMNSYGGDPYAMLALYDVIQACTCQIKFYGKGAIMSAATWIMVGCDERYLYPNTTIMIHEGSNEPGRKPVTDQDIYQEEEKRLQDKLCEIYAENSRMPKDFWTTVCQRDMYITAEEALLLGLADKIVHPKKRGNFRKVRENHLSEKIDKRKMTRVVEKLYKRIKMPETIQIVIQDHKPELIDESLTIEKKPNVVQEENKDLPQST